MTPTWPPHGVRLVERTTPHGAVVLAPIPEHRADIHLTDQTRTTCRSSGLRHARVAGDIDIVPAGKEGGYDADTPSTALEVRLTSGFVARVAEQTGRAGSRSGLVPRHVLSDPATRHLAWAFVAAHRASVPVPQLYLDSLGVAFAIHLLDREAGPLRAARGLSTARLQRVIDYIEANLGDPLGLDELAQVAGASSAHLRRWFKAHTGEAIHRYVVRRRVERARELLLRGSLTTSAIALEVGFAHPSHMARWMRRLLGVTPRELTLA